MAEEFSSSENDLRCMLYIIYPCKYILLYSCMVSNASNIMHYSPRINFCIHTWRFFCIALHTYSELNSVFQCRTEPQNPETGFYTIQVCLGITPPCLTWNLQWWRVLRICIYICLFYRRCINCRYSRFLCSSYQIIPTTLRPWFRFST